MRALVTGGAGLIGSHLADLLYKKGYEVVILDNLERETHIKKPDWIKKEYLFIKGDVRNKNILAKVLVGVDLVFHQAAYGGFTPQINKYIDVNCRGTANIFEVIKEKKLKVKKVVLASSQGIYGEGQYSCIKHGLAEPELRSFKQLKQGRWEMKCLKCQRILTPQPTIENKKQNPGSVYSITKLSEELLAIRLGQMLEIPTVALRYAVTYGPRQSIFNPYTGVISIFSTRILNGLSPVVYEDGKQTRDFINVADVAGANYLVSQKTTANFRVFNVSTGIKTSILGLISLLNKTYGTNIKPIIKGEFRAGEVRHLVLDNARLTGLGWEPLVKLEDGIQGYVDWIKTQGNVKEFWSRAYQMMRANKIVLRAK